MSANGSVTRRAQRRVPCGCTDGSGDARPVTDTHEAAQHKETRVRVTVFLLVERDVSELQNFWTITYTHIYIFFSLLKYFSPLSPDITRNRSCTCVSCFFFFLFSFACCGWSRGTMGDSVFLDRHNSYLVSTSLNAPPIRIFVIN